ncbi:hypothetical protein K1W69_24410 [Hoeflea sp. WL0058]|uniref:Glycosyltransferase RgtA/B/C/D-like domain-containing protein n=1 Tax=Flavimaribacter sediminis TaxID=2865987 RepID=A0AAE3D3Q7_9HYPH|nr:hypothetical protein [Flavimaribacter sediminis]MBW8640357.1 hypothetical protein [Flavimaribacter sediminis]
MRTKSTKPANESLYLGLAWGLIAFALFVATSGNLEFHVDEVITYRVVQETWSEIARERLGATHSPVYFWLVKPLYSISDDPHILRYPSSLFSAIGFGVMVAALGSAISKRIANIYAIGLMTCPGWIYLAHFARPYALLVMLMMLGMASLLVILARTLAKEQDAIGQPETPLRHWIILSVSTALAPAVLMSGALYVVALSFTPLLNADLRRSRTFLARWWRAMLPGLASAALFSWLLSSAIIRKSDSYWVDRRSPLSFDTFSRVVSRTFSSIDPSWTSASQTLESIIAVAGVVLVLSAFLLRSRHRALFWTALPAAISLPILYVLISFKTSLMVDRYFFLTTPGVFALIAISTDYVWRKRIGAGLLLILLSGLLLQAANAYFWPHTQRLWRNSVEHMLEARKDSDVLVVYPPNRVLTVKIILDYEFSLDESIEVTPGPGSDEELERLIAATIEREGRIWIIDDWQSRNVRPILDRRSDLAACRMRHRSRPVHVITDRATPNQLPKTCEAYGETPTSG